MNATNNTQTTLLTIKYLLSFLRYLHYRSLTSLTKQITYTTASYNTLLTIKFSHYFQRFFFFTNTLFILTLPCWRRKVTPGTTFTYAPSHIHTKHIDTHIKRNSSSPTHTSYYPDKKKSQLTEKKLERPSPQPPLYHSSTLVSLTY